VPSLEFDAIVRSAKGGGAVVALPDEAAEVFGTRARFPVRAMFNEVEYYGSTMPTGEGRFCLGITKAIRAEAGIDFGDRVHVVIELDSSRRTIDTPADLTTALDEAQLAGAFSALSLSHRREYVQWITEAKGPLTRQRRIAKVVETLARESGLSV
jgi:hypothetical protein